jgi:serine/threonine protein kinase/tetratricopeptide (TPR) repeat protein
MQPGTVVAGRYVVVELAGSGGMSTVYKARDRSGDLVALKVLKLQAAHQVARFLRETNLLHKLRHPAIVSYLDSGLIEDSGQYFLVLEWLEGRDLHSFLGEGRLGIDDSLRLAERIADALGFAHAQGVVHRDVKPENIFLPGGDAAQAKLLDFGIARWANAMEALTSTGARFGTPAYMSPEQVRGDRDLDARADVFSLGCVLYECITGEPAFAATDPMAVFGKILFDDPPRASALAPDVPEAVEALLQRTLARRPADRPTSGDELAAEIRALRRQVSSAQPVRQPRSQPKQHTLTDLEQRLVSVVVAMLDSAAYEAAMLLAPRTDTSPPQREPRDTELDGQGRASSSSPTNQPATLPVTLDAAVRTELEAMGARVGLLQSGLLVVVFEQRGTSMHATAADQAAQAARAALLLRHGFPRALVALATGRAVIHQRGLVGQVIDDAVALLGAAGDSAGSAEAIAGVRVDEVTVALLGDRLTVERTPGGALYLAGEPRHHSRSRVREQRSPFVGRNSELATLVATLDECLDESVTRALLVTGPAGFGKSRLCEEFLRRVQAIEHELGERIEVWMAHGDPMRGGSPLHLFSSALRRAADIVDSEPVSVRRDKLRAHVERHLERDSAHRVALFLAELLKIGVPEDDADVQLRAARRDPLLMGDQVRRACADLLDAETAARPLVIVLEDLHWGDRATVEVIDLAMRNLVERPLLVLALGRPEVREMFPQLWVGHNLTEIRLNRLSRRAAEKLVRAGLGGDAEHAQMAAVVERGDGNPFYLEELVRRVAAGHQTLPDTVMAMVQGRLGALDPQARRVLRAGSVFGPTFWRGGVVALAGADIPVERWLETLVELGLITEVPTSRFAGEVEFGFRHALIGEAAYDMLTEEDRRLGHQLAGRWLAAAGEQDARLLAEHLDRGGVRSEALPYYRRAAEDALDRSDFDAAVAMAERGIACGATGAALGALRHVQMEERVWRGNPTEVVALGTEAMQLLPRGSRAWFDVAGEVAIAQGKRDEIAHVESLAELIGASGETDDAAGRCIALAKVAQVLFACGHRARADALLAALEGEISELDVADPVVAANLHFARAFRADTVLADPAAVLLETERCAAFFEAIGDARQACFHRTNVGYAKLELGLFREAERDLRSALAIAERMAIDLAANTARQNLALACAYLGALAEARVLGRQACRWFEEREDARELALSRLYLATVLILDQDVEEAAREAKAALALLPAAAPLRAFALATLARAHLLRAQNHEALQTAREAYRLLESLRNIESGESLVRLVMAEALHATGATEDARSIINQACDVLRARASTISRADWRRSFLENIPDHVRMLALAERWQG